MLRIYLLKYEVIKIIQQSEGALLDADAIWTFAKSLSFLACTKSTSRACLSCFRRLISSCNLASSFWVLEETVEHEKLNT